MRFDFVIAVIRGYLCEIERKRERRMNVMFLSPRCLLASFSFSTSPEV